MKNKTSELLLENSMLLRLFFFTQALPRQLGVSFTRCTVVFLLAHFLIAAYLCLHHLAILAPAAAVWKKMMGRLLFFGGSLLRGDFETPSYLSLFRDEEVDT